MTQIEKKLVRLGAQIEKLRVAVSKGRNTKDNQELADHLWAADCAVFLALQKLEAAR